jgi:hypothetical protein
MEEWEEFSAFGDIAVLERVCELLEDRASALRDGIPVEVADLVGSDSALVGRLEKQDVQSAAILIAERPDRPGLYAKTWMAKLIAGLYLRLSEIAERPKYLPDELPRLELDFHKVLIAAHDIFDPHHRAALVAQALTDGRQNAMNERSQQARDAVRSRGDQKQKAEFDSWAKESLAAGASANTVENLQGLTGFNPAWSKMSEKTLKKWACDAGFKFRTGRPPKKK